MSDGYRGLNTFDSTVADEADDVTGLIESARDAGVVLWLKEGQLRFRCEHSSRCDAALEWLRAHKAAVIEVLKAQQTPGYCSDALAPLSFFQERLWLNGPLGLAGELYHRASALRIEGPVSHAALLQAFVLLTHRHESLRTRFTVREGRPVQIVDRPRPRVMAICDLSSLPFQSAEIVLRQLADEWATRRFDLEVEHPLRVLLLRRHAGEHLLLITLHSMAVDASALAIATRDLMELYAALCSSRPASLPSLPIRYQDFARWQQSSRAGGSEDGSLQFWRNELAGIPTVLRLPTSYPRPAVADLVGGDVSFQLSGQTTQALKRMAEHVGATLFMATLALFQMLLYRISAQKEFIIGTYTSGRPWPELEEVIGNFVNKVPLRTTIADGWSFMDVLTAAQRTSLQAFAHQGVPYHSIVAMHEPSREPSRQPLVQVALSYRSIALPKASAAAALTMRTLVTRFRSIRTDLMFNAHEEEGALHGQFLYATQLFERAFVQRLAESFCDLAEQVVARPDAGVADIPLREACAIDEERR